MDNLTDNYVINQPDMDHFNTYLGSVYQQSTSVVVHTDKTAYQHSGGNFATYGLEYWPGLEEDEAYISWWVNGELRWAMNAAGVGADPIVNISARSIPYEPMYIIFNLGLSYNFGDIALDLMEWPNLLLVDYVRLYQRTGARNVGCDPDGYPTSDYINLFPEVYNVLVDLCASLVVDCDAQRKPYDLGRFGLRRSEERPAPPGRPNLPESARHRARLAQGPHRPGVLPPDEPLRERRGGVSHGPSAATLCSSVLLFLVSSSTPDFHALGSNFSYAWPALDTPSLYP